MNLRTICTPRKGRTRAHLFEILTQIKLVALEVAATILFLVWLYREVLYELRR